MKRKTSKIQTIIAILACFALTGMFTGCYTDVGSNGSNGNNAQPETPQGLTITGLPPQGDLPYTINIFNVDTNLSTVDAINSALMSPSQIALGAILLGDDFFTIGDWNSILGITGAWTSSGYFLVILADPRGTFDDAQNPFYRRATVNFYNGRAVFPFSSFVPVVDTFTVTFRCNVTGVWFITSQYVKSGNLASRPQDQTRPGWSFRNWYTTDALTTEFDFNTPITDDITLFAGWNPVVTHVTVTNNADSGPGSLRYAIENAIDNVVISIQDDIGTITLSHTLSIWRSLTIEGNGVTITRTAEMTGGAHSLLHIGSSPVTIRRVHFKDGRARNWAAAIQTGSRNLILESCIFSGNQTTSPTFAAGGAIYNTGSLTVVGSTFLNNSMTGFSGGGAIFQTGSNSTLTLTGNIFYGNTHSSGFFPVVRRNGGNQASGGTIITGGFNVVDVPSGDISNRSGWHFANGDTTFAALGISGVPINTTTFEPVQALRNVIPFRPANFPLYDFNGNPRTWPGAPGAVR